MKVQLCPKCQGQGIVSRPPWVPGDVSTWSSTAAVYQCDVCHGAKIIYLPDDPTPCAECPTNEAADMIRVAESITVVTAAMREAIESASEKED